MESYQENYETTKSIVKLYLKLAELEKEKKQKSKEYQDIIGLLKYELVREKEKGSDIYKQVGRTYYYDMVQKQPKENYFVTLETEMLAAIRFANHIDNEYLYALDGIVLKEKYQKLQKNLDIHFYHSIRHYLKFSKLSNEEKNSLIDFQYGLLATSIPVEENVFTGECFLPFTNISMNYQELQMSSIYVYKKVEVLLNCIINLKDSEITDQTLPMVLYVKSCIPMLPPLMIGSILQELKNTLGLIKLCGHITGESRDKICSMLSSLLETEFQKAKK